MSYTISYKVEPSFSHSDCLLLTLTDENYPALFERKRNNWERDITAHISSEQKQFILAHLKSLHTGISQNPMMGLDGTTYRLKIESDTFVSVEYCWWVSLPEEWIELKPVITILDKFVKTRELYEE